MPVPRRSRFPFSLLPFSLCPSFFSLPHSWLSLSPPALSAPSFPSPPSVDVWQQLCEAAVCGESSQHADSWRCWRGARATAACRWKAVLRRCFTYSVKKVIFGWRRSRKAPLEYWRVTWVPGLGAVRLPSGGRDVLSRRSDVSKSRNLLSSCHSGLLSQEFFSANFLNFKAVSGELYTCVTIKIGQWKLHFFFMPFAHFLNGFRRCVLQIFVQFYHLSFAFYILLFLRK